MSETPTSDKLLYSEVCAIKVVGENEWTAEIDPRWTILGNPNGGYLQTVMADAGAMLSPDHPHVVAISTHFLRSPRPGRVVLNGEVLRHGRTTTQVRMRMMQGDQPTGESLITFGEVPQDRTSDSWSSARLPSLGRPFSECPRFIPPREVFPVEIYHWVGVHLEPGQTSFTTGQGRGIGEVRAWVNLPGGEDFTPASLLFAADVLPPATFDIKPGGWVPTMELSTYIRALPAAGPVNVLLTANLIRDGRVDETATVWDSTGELVAQSHQLAGIRFA